MTTFQKRMDALYEYLERAVSEDSPSVTLNDPKQLLEDLEVLRGYYIHYGS